MKVQTASIGTHLFMPSLRQKGHSRRMHLCSRCTSHHSGDSMHGSDTAVKTWRAGDCAAMDMNMYTRKWGPQGV